MAEEIEGQDTGVEAVAGGVDPAAVGLALTGADRSEANAYLKDQRALAANQSALIADQRHHLREKFKHLHLSVWEKRLGVWLRGPTIFVGIVVAAGFALMVWDAAHSKGLIIEPFTVPPDLAAKGLTGEVVGSQMIDKLTAMSKRESSRAVQSYANDWGNDIKVEIPETGVSIGELRNFFREWLGHDIRITGEVYKYGDGIAVTARTSGEEGSTFTGKEGDLDALVQQAAEHVYEVTQPYRYANYLDRNYDPRGLQQRIAKARVIYRRLIAGDDPVERAWAWNGPGTIEYNFYGDNRKAAFDYRKAIATVPNFTIAYYALASRDGPLGQEEDDFVNLREAARLLHGGATADLNRKYARGARLSSDSRMAAYLGDYATAIPIAKEGVELPDEFSVLARSTFISVATSAMARRHDWGALRAYMRDLGWTEVPMSLEQARAMIDLAHQDWQDILAIEAYRNSLPARPVAALPGRTLLDPTSILRPFFALAHAHSGDFSGAERLLAPLARDRDMDLRTQALIAELQTQHARADWWFARSERRTPSLPLTDLWWGQALLERGQPDAAIEKFKLSNQKGSHFADPLEGWGEALMAKNQSHLALAKFAEANEYAPNWGRLHLKWGEALFYLGKKDEARAQYRKASTLDLTPADKADLATDLAHT